MNGKSIKRTPIWNTNVKGIEKTSVGGERESNRGI